MTNLEHMLDQLFRRIDGKLDAFDLKLDEQGKAIVRLQVLDPNERLNGVVTRLEMVERRFEDKMRAMEDRISTTHRGVAIAGRRVLLLETRVTELDTEVRASLGRIEQQLKAEADTKRGRGEAMNLVAKGSGWLLNDGLKLMVILYVLWQIGEPFVSRIAGPEINDIRSRFEGAER